MASIDSLPKTHRALVVNSRSEPIVVEEARPLPQLTSGSAIVRVLAVHLISYAGEIYNGKRPYPFPTPLVPGGAGVARVAAVGPDATTLAPGQLVFVEIFLIARDNTNQRALFGAFSGDNPAAQKLMEYEWRDATLAEYARVPLENVILLDEKRLLGSPSEGGLGYTVEDLSYLEEVLIPYGGLIDIDLKPGETIIVAPATGGFGGAAVQVALAMGAGKVIAMGRNEEALARVQKLDSGRVTTVKLTGSWESELEALRKAADGEDIDAFFDISPRMAQNSTHFKAGIMALRRGGRVSFMGGLLEDLPLPIRHIMHANIQLKGKWMYEREDIPKIMKLVHRGLLKLGEKGGNQIVGKFGLEQWKEAFDTAAEKAQLGQMAVMVP